MMVSCKWMRFDAWLVRIVFVAVVCALPIHLASAQDYGAIKKRLGDAVDKGEISEKQAAVMLEALLRVMEPSDKKEKGREDVIHRVNQIKKLIESGELSREKGGKLIEETHKSLGASDRKRQDEKMAAQKQKFADIAREIKAAVGAGDLTKEEASQKLNAVRKEMFGQLTSPKANLKGEALRERMRAIEQKVKSGDLTREEAAKLFRETKQAMENASRTVSKPQKQTGGAEQQVKEIQRRIESGELPAEKGKAIIEKIKASTKSGRKPAEKTANESRTRLAEIQRKLKEEVQAGNLTREEAREKLMQLRKELIKD